MKRIFISSVIRGFEPFRAAAKAAVELMGHTPVGSEDFGARAYSSRQACLTEVEQCDVLLLVLGYEFGFETSEGTSVTQAEFRHARLTGKPILAFVQDAGMTGKQGEFRREVEDFESGLFRGSFSTPEELKDEVIRGLRLLDMAGQAWPEQRFVELLEGATEASRTYRGTGGAQLSIAFLPQPVIEVHLPDMDSQADVIFKRLCDSRLAVLRDGYELEEDADVFGMRSGETVLRIFEDGLKVLSLSASAPARERGGFDSMFVPPSRVRALGEAAFDIFVANSGWCQVALQGMQSHALRELPPQGTTSVSIPMFGDERLQERRLFQPLVRAAYERWVAQVVERFVRRHR